MAHFTFTFLPHRCEGSYTSYVSTCKVGSIWSTGAIFGQMPFPTSPITHIGDGRTRNRLTKQMPFPTSPIAHTGDGRTRNRLTGQMPFPTSPKTHIGDGRTRNRLTEQMPFPTSPLAHIGDDRTQNQAHWADALPDVTSNSHW